MRTHAQFAVFRRCHRKSKRLSPAFTLVELVLVIAVLGLLLLTALARPPNKAYQTGCINNLRQVGDALFMFTEDNSDRLPPGPIPPGVTVYQADSYHLIYFLTQAQSPAYSDTHATSTYQKLLAYYLAPYLGYPQPSAISNTTKVVKAMLCPGYVSTFPANSCGTMPPAWGIPYEPRSDTPPYANACCYSITRTNAYPQSLLPGYPFGKESMSFPLKISAIARAAPLREIWACGDFDCQSVANPSGLGSVFVSGFVASNPVHGNVRNFLYFDNHVGTKPVTGYQDY